MDFVTMNKNTSNKKAFSERHKFEVLMAILLNITVFWGVTPYSLVATVQILE
jgi:hypothetical protein